MERLARVARKALGGEPPAARDAGHGLRVVGLSLVKNEEDVIEPFVRHNLRFLDAMFVADNGSADRTREILVALEREGLPVVVFDDPVTAYNQSEKMTTLLRGVCAATLPDYVVPLDADEFIRSSPAAFREELARIPPGGVGLVPWSTYVVSPDDVSGPISDPPRSLAWRRRAELPQYRKVILRLDGRYASNIVLAQGNHSAERDDGAALAAVPLDGLALAHFPVRSESQLTSKAVVGWMAYLARDRDARRSSLGFQWRDNFDAALARGGIPRSELPERSLMYAQDARPIEWSTDIVRDPLDFTYVRRYGSGQREPALATIARSWERALCPPPSLGDGLRQAIAQKWPSSGRETTRRRLRSPTRRTPSGRRTGFVESSTYPGRWEMAQPAHWTSRTRISWIVVLVAVAGSCATTNRRPMAPFAYSEVIERIAPGPATDRRPELRRCVQGWGPWAAVRQTVFAALFKTDPAREAVLVEVGHPTWAVYGYAVVIDGVIRQDGVARAGVAAERTGIPSPETIQSHVESDVDDGTCWFLTIVKDGRKFHAAYYGPLAASNATAGVLAQLKNDIVMPRAPESHPPANGTERPEQPGFRAR